MRSMDGPFSRPRVVSCVAHCCRSTCGAGRGTSQAAWGARRRPCPRIYGMTARRGGCGRCRVVPACVPVLRARCGTSRFSFSGFAHRRAVPAAPRSPGEAPSRHWGSSVRRTFRRRQETGKIRNSRHFSHRFKCGATSRRPEVIRTENTPQLSCSQLTCAAAAAGNSRSSLYSDLGCTGTDNRIGSGRAAARPARSSEPHEHATRR